MMTLKLYGLTLAVFLLLDFVWLGLIMKNFYNAELGELARREAGSLAPRWGAAILVYLLIPAGLALFVRPQLAENSSYGMALLYGALFGLVLYGVYDWTNYALIEKWSLKMTLIDWLWGATICAVATAAMQWLMTKWIDN